MNLILASASPRRKELLSRLGYSFEIQTAAVTERTEGPWRTLALENALLKAEAVAQKYPDDLVIGADTVIEFENRILGKPQDEEDAFRMLSLFSGKTHQVITGCALLCVSEKIRIRFAEVSDVTFRSLSPEQIREYLHQVSVLDKAGAYAIQERGETIVEHVNGSLDNVIGFPLERIAEALKMLEKNSGLFLNL